MLKFILLTLLFLFLGWNSSFGQRKLSGIVIDETETAIPLAKVFIKNDPTQRTVCNQEGYFELFLLPGEYYLVVQANGYEDREVFIGMTDAEMTRNIFLLPINVKELGEVGIVAKKTNPGRDIILKVVEKRDTINMWKYPHSTDVYIKTVEKINRDAASSSTKKGKTQASVDPNKEIEDPFAVKKKQDELLVNNMNLLEVEIAREFEPQNKVKEHRMAVTLHGNASNMYYTTTVRANFNFFQNLMHLDDLHQTPVTSPISIPGILSYKYRLEEQYVENGRKIHKIKITSRSSSTSTLEGYIWVVDSVYLVQKLELTLNKGNLIIYDYFTIQQEFDLPGDTLCLLKKQTLSYGVTYNKISTHLTTNVQFDNYNFEVNFAKKYFNSELAVTEKEAYERDSAYWNNHRKGDLSVEEVRYIMLQDSIRDFHNRKEYLDSLDAEFNKVTALKVLWFGIDQRNREKKTQWTLSSIVSMSRPFYIAGPRVAPNFFFFKKWKDERTLDSYTELSLGFMNWDVKGNSWWRYRYDPFHFGTIAAEIEQDFGANTWNDAITEIYKRENFFEKTALTIIHDYELFNGLYLNNSLNFAERRSINHYKFITKFDDFVPNSEAKEFPTYQAFLLTARLSYTPGQKYMREPYRKVILGSKWPTFYLFYERGIPKLFGSDVDHDYIRLGIEQTLKIGTLGTTSYHLHSGKFLSSNVLKDADFKYFRRSDPLWFSNPLSSFQGLDTNLPTKKLYFSAHLIHHDNGSILNKIPFVKKARIGLVGGAGMLLVPEHNFQHYEVLLGLERIFKLSKRRLRMGVYCAFSDGNTTKARADWKFSIAFLDNRSLKWNF